MSDKIIRSTNLTQYAFKDGNQEIILIDYMLPSSIPSFWDCWDRTGSRHTVHYNKVFIVPEEGV